MSVGVVIVAAGRGIRAGGDIPKQWRELSGLTVAEHALRAFACHDDITKIAIVVNSDDRKAGLVPDIEGVCVVTGGATRSASVLAGLQALEDVDKVLIHDAARPCVSQIVIDDVIAALDEGNAAAPAVAVVDALWTGENGRVTGTADRTGLFRAQTPQGFSLQAILDAHRRFPEGGADDVELARKAGMDVAITQGEENNLKITTAADFARAEAILRSTHGYKTG